MFGKIKEIADDNPNKAKTFGPHGYDETIVGYIPKADTFFNRIGFVLEFYEKPLSDEARERLKEKAKSREEEIK